MGSLQGAASCRDSGSMMVGKESATVSKKQELSQQFWFCFSCKILCKQEGETASSFPPASWGGGCVSGGVKPHSRHHLPSSLAVQSAAGPTGRVFHSCCSLLGELKARYKFHIPQLSIPEAHSALK